MIKEPDLILPSIGYFSQLFGKAICYLYSSRRGSLCPHMNIGLLTLMHGHNYGGVLQCYALQRALTDMGHTVQVIDYHFLPAWRRIRFVSHMLGKRVGSKVMNQLGYLRYGQRIHRKFEAFRTTHLSLSQPCATRAQLKNLIGNYDVLVVGSDQVWNTEWFTPEYFLDFTDDFSGKRVSYAACFGSGASRASELVYACKPWLERFDHISVRNKMSMDLVKDLCGRSAAIVADPTLLVDFSHLSNALPNNLQPQTYVLLYGLSEKRYADHLNRMRFISDQMSLPLVGIRSAVMQPWLTTGCDDYVDDPSPEDWITLIENTAFLVTDSFHGMLFAIKNRIPFLNYIGMTKSYERVAYAATHYGVSSGVPTDWNWATTIAPTVDWDAVHDQINSHRTLSRQFLKTAIHDNR